VFIAQSQLYAIQLYGLYSKCTMLSDFSQAVSLGGGYRTPPIAYSQGKCGKCVARLHAQSKNSKPSVLLLWDSNCRNLVSPKVINLTSTSAF